MTAGFLAALEAARTAPLGPPGAAEPGLAAADLAAFDALHAGAAPAEGVVTDWFGLRTPADLAPDLAAFAGRLLPRAPRDPRATLADWVGLAHGVAGADDTWRGLALGAGRGDLLLAGMVAARRRGLAVQAQATEPEPARRAALLRHAEANGIAEGMLDILPRRAAPGAAQAGDAALSDLLAAAPRWDWLRLAQPGLVVPALNQALPLLAARVRILAIVTRHRGEEARAVSVLSESGWTLLADVPCRLSRADPRKAERPGAQAWRAPD